MFRRKKLRSKPLYFFNFNAVRNVLILNDVFYLLSIFQIVKYLRSTHKMILIVNNILKLNLVNMKKCHTLVELTLKS